MDYYKILEVSERADTEEIKQAYRRKAKKYHPDRNPDNPEAESKFKDVAKAYEILGNEEKRKKYDLKRKMSSDCGIINDKDKVEPADMADFTKDMERYFGFSFPRGQESKQRQDAGKTRKNPLDVTEMFETFMKMR